MLATDNKLCSNFQGLKTCPVLFVLILVSLNKINLFNQTISLLIITQLIDYLFINYYLISWF